MLGRKRYYNVVVIRTQLLLGLSDIASVSSKEFFYIQATTECGFTLTRVCDIIKTHNV